MNKKRVRIVLLLLLVALVAGAWWYSGTRQIAPENRLTLYGNIDIREADLAFNNVEHINELLVQEGDRVKKGQLLATLHSERMAAATAAAQARVASRKAALARLESGSRPEEIRQARADVAAARARLADAAASHKRIKNLVTRKVASQQALDDAQAGLETARAQLKIAQEAQALAVEGPRSEDIDEAKAALKAEQAQLALAQEVLNDASLYAPDDGVIRSRILEPGDMVSPQTPVLTLAKNNPVWVRSYLPEPALGKVVPGMKAEVSTDSYPDKTYRGWVGFISPTAEFTPKNVETPELRTRLVYQLRIHVCNTHEELRLGMPATVIIPLDQPKPAAVQAMPDCTARGDGQGER